MDYFTFLGELFVQHADPQRAAGAKSYMRNISDFYGIPAPLRKELLKKFLQREGYPDPSQLEEMVKFAWEQPRREWQYAAMEILERFARKGSAEVLQLAEIMITRKSWWDTVDYIAPNIAGAVFRNHPEIIRQKTEEWMYSGNLWLRRSCLLFQLKYRTRTDEALLFEFCTRLSGEKDFFIRKAIGWSLREYSKVKPEVVAEFVRNTPLSPLSQREALKRIRV